MCSVSPMMMNPMMMGGMMDPMMMGMMNPMMGMMNPFMATTNMMINAQTGGGGLNALAVAQDPLMVFGDAERGRYRDARLDFATTERLVSTKTNEERLKNDRILAKQTAPVNDISRRAVITSELISAKRQNKVLPSFDKLTKLCEEYYGMHGDEAKVKAQEIYFQLQGNTITQEITDKTTGSFGLGFKKATLIGMFSKDLREAKSSGELVAAIQGEEAPSKEKTLKGLGMAGTAVTFGGIALGTGAAFNLVPALKSVEGQTTRNIIKGLGKYGLIGGSIAAVATSLMAFIF